MSLLAERISKPGGHKAQRRSDGPLYQMLGGRLVSIADNGKTYIDKGYNINDIVYSIINLILDKVRVAPWAFYKVKDESSLKQFHAIMAKKLITAEDFRMAKDLRVKAMELVKDPGRFGELLKNPNPDDNSFGDFVANGSGYKLLTGNRCIYADLLEGGGDKGLPMFLYNMPSQFMQLLCTSLFPSRITGYQISVAGLTEGSKFTAEQVLHDKYMNYNWSVNGEQHWGIAPLKAALKRLNRSNSSLDASTAKIQNGGVEAIVYVDDQRLDGDESLTHASALKTKLIQELTGPENWGKITASGYKIGVENLGLSPVELDLLQAEKWDQRAFCNVFGVPSQLMNDPDNKIYGNMKEGEKALTNRCALPLLTSFRNAFNRKLHNVWGLKQKDWFADFDMTVFTELQQDVKEMMEWLKDLIENGFPMNRALELLNIEKIDDKLFDEPWVRQAMGTPMSEWKMGEADRQLNNDPENENGAGDNEGD
jgi:HK97 family phage portal protein